jgi:hypothetical protein
MPLSLAKIEEKAPALLSLAKTVSSSLTRFGLDGHTAKVALVLDYSGSMRGTYANGSMQRLAEKALALGTQFDDDGAIDLFFFDSSAEHAGEVTIDDYHGAVDELKPNRRMGSTSYTDAFEAVQEHYGFGAQKKGFFGKKSGGSTTLPVKDPVFVIFLTDGVPDNKTSAVNKLVELSNYPIFWKFLSIGSESIPFLEKLDDLTNRTIDNADYKPIGNVDKLSDDQFFDVLFDEYKGYLTEAKSHGFIQ